MRHRWSVISTALAAVLVVTGCDGPIGRPDLHGVEWLKVAGRDLNCVGQADLIDEDYYDIGGGTYDAEAFVTMRCRPVRGTKPQPDQLEVFRGGSARGNPERIAVIVHRCEGMRLGAVTFSNDHVSAFDSVTRRTVEATWVPVKDKKLEYRSKVVQGPALPTCVE